MNLAQWTVGLALSGIPGVQEKRVRAAYSFSLCSGLITDPSILGMGGNAECEIHIPSSPGSLQTQDKNRWLRRSTMGLGPAHQIYRRRL